VPPTADVLALHARAAKQVAALVAAVPSAQMGRPTPCTEWDVRALIGHVVDLNRLVAARATGAADPAPVDLAAGDDPAAAVARAHEAVTAILAAPGALDRSFAMPWGEQTGEILAWELFIDLVAHAWDLHRAVDALPPLDPALCEAALAKARELIVDAVHRVPGGIGPEVVLPAAAPVCDRFAGFYGRRVDGGVGD
jgi:uncharacterized protein (TIGR03086 family)